MIRLTEVPQGSALSELPLAGREAERVREVSAYDALGPGSPRLLRLAQEAAAIAGTRVAVVNLIGGSVQRTVAAAGIEATLTPRVDSLCSRIIGERRTVHVADASQDPRFAGNPFVDGRRGSIRFYGGHPLVSSDGLVLGTLCVLDGRPRTLHPSQVEALDAVAAEVVAVLEDWRRATRVA